MRFSPKLAELVAKATEGMPLRQVSLRTSLSHTTVSALRANGQVPRARTLAQFAVGLDLTADQRRDLFAAAGLRDPLIPAEGVDASDFEALSPEDRELLDILIRAFIEARRRK